MKTENVHVEKKSHLRLEGLAKKIRQLFSIVSCISQLNFVNKNVAWLIYKDFRSGVFLRLRFPIETDSKTSKFLQRTFSKHCLASEKTLRSSDCLTEKKKTCARFDVRIYIFLFLVHPF